jgi:hypothetical protein
MKRKKLPANSPASDAVETFGGDYYRLEATFRPKSGLPTTAKSEEDKNTRPRKGGGKKTA